MKNIGIALIGISLLAFRCNSNTSEKNGFGNENINPVFAGNWISKNYIDSLDKYGTPARVKDGSCEELVINFSCDSLCRMIPGEENIVFKISNKNDTSFRVKKFNQDDYTVFALSKDKKELLYSNKNGNKTLTFAKMESKYAVKMVNGWQSATELFLNEQVIAANYFLINSENKQGAVVAFTSYGKISGLPGYTDYSICYGGDCRNRCTDDFIIMSEKDTSENFIWDWKNDTLIFYSATNISKKTGQPYYVKGMDIFKFRKKL